MADPTSAQKIRLAAVHVVAPVLLDRGYDSEHIVGEADVIARFVKNGELPVDEDDEPEPDPEEEGPEG